VDLALQGGEGGADLLDRERISRDLHRTAPRIKASPELRSRIIRP
jgi:hypothetical protein